MSLINDALIQARTEVEEQDRDGTFNKHLLDGAVPYMAHRQPVISVVVAVSLCLTLAGASWAFISNFQGGLSHPAPMALAEDSTLAVQPPAPEAAAEPNPADQTAAAVDAYAPAATGPTPTETAAAESPLAEAEWQPTSTEGDRPAKGQFDGKTFLRSVMNDGLPRLTLNGIVWSVDAPVALLNGSMVRPGDEVLDTTILAIEPNRVKVAFRDVVFYVRIP